MSKKKLPYKIQKINNPENKYLDIYHNLLKISWLELLLYYILFFVVINTIFAFLYTIVPGSISVKDFDYISAFFFSVHTFSTVGYGTISPINLYGNIVVVIEIMTGVISVAITTGLVFAKFSKPSAKILYSKNLLLTKFDGEDVLMFRIANARSNQIISANVELHYLYNSTSVEGQKIIRFAPLKLQKNYSPLFSLSWSVFHTINQESPFFGKSLEEIQKLKYEFMVVFNGTDGTFSQNIFDTHSYNSLAIVEGHHFMDILHRKEDGTRVIDYKNFHKLQKS